VKCSERPWRAALGLLLAAMFAAHSSARADDAFLEPAAAVGATLDLLQERLSLMPSVAAAKQARGLAASDPQRESLVLQRAATVGASMGLEEQPVRALFAQQLRLAVQLQSTLLARWARGEAPPPADPPDLETGVRPRIDELTSAILRAVYLAAPALAEPGAAARYADLARARLAADGWSDAARAAALEVLAQQRLAAGPSLARVRAAGVLRIGTTGDYAPFSLEANGVLQGADIDLARDIAAALGLEPAFVRTSWARLADDLRSDRFDLALGGVSVTPERAAAGAFSVPYASGGKAIVARCTHASRYRSLRALDRPGVRLIVNPGGTNEQFVRAHVHRAQLVLHPDNRSIFEALLAGEADAMITDDAEIGLQVLRHPQLCRTSGALLTRAQKAALVARDPALLAAVNAVLRRELASGAIARRQRQFLHRPPPPAAAGAAR
jgi:cyclohexadienyl dehydratase